MRIISLVKTRKIAELGDHKLVFVNEVVHEASIKLISSYLNQTSISRLPYLICWTSSLMRVHLHKSVISMRNILTIKISGFIHKCSINSYTKRFDVLFSMNFEHYEISRWTMIFDFSVRHPCGEYIKCSFKNGGRLFSQILARCLPNN